MDELLKPRVGRVLIRLLLLTWGLAGCGTTVSTRVSGLKPVSICLPSETLPNTAPKLREWAGTDSNRLALAAAVMLKQSKTKKHGSALVAAWFAWESLQRSGVKAAEWLSTPQTAETLRLYNAAVARFVKRHAVPIVQGKPEVIFTDLGPVKLSGASGDSVRFRAGYYDSLLIASQVKVSGFRNRVTLPGIGAALVALRSRTPEREKEMDYLPPSGVASALTAVLIFQTHSRGILSAQIELRDPSRHVHVRMGNSSLPLAADFTAPLAFSFAGQNDLLLGIRNLFNVALGNEDAGIYLTEPLDPNRIPILLIHGLSSSPIVWRNVVNEATRDPVIRKRFQFWYAFYSTGAPVMESAAQIKRDVVEIRQKFPNSVLSKHLAIIGYSMGGVIAQILVTNIGDHLWNTISPVPFDQVKFDPEDVADLRRSLFWTALPHVQQVIFISTPHKGTRMADASFARFADLLIRLPDEVIGFQRRVFSALAEALGPGVQISTKVTGLNSLSAESPLYQALAKVPLAKGVKVYSVLGDRGRGDSPSSTDGIVGYWSSHFDGAESELIVPTGHDAQASPLTEKEIQRILLQDVSRK